jgi:hypothetical protein
MIVTDYPSGGFPDVFLRVEIRRCGWQEHNLQAWVGLQDGLNLRATMPGCTIPQEQDGVVRIGQQDFVQEQG